MKSTGVETSGAGEEKAALVAEQQPRVAGEKKQGRKVLVAVDDSDGSFYALKWTLDHLFNMNPAAELPTAGGDVVEPAGSDSSMIVLVNVQKPYQPYVYPAGPVIYPTTTVVESVRKAQAENAAAVLSRALQMCKDVKVKAETMILEGEPKDMICDVAEDLHVDLVVVGSRGLSKFKRAFLGSVSDYCAHHVQCPILIVKPPREEQVHDK
ncbi:OLC1v1033960C1 [Oldenlandia corymbosa var. corymbosa]|uniref:OLC1v1033960C1 n=1 Tax=Oldenlandia corymbosa var. corymbosa TaxID=529605 RepID=A0AAV1CPF9_OLDCO|nr:OLC1v1033960C1 [Oldenlandia corymbosa var. corymbosa]